MKKKKIIIDLFAGAGGESCGIHQAFQEKDEGIRLYAVNHWDRACETHALNYPSDEVICQDIQTLIPTDLVSPKEDVELMWASPECTSHSRAKGSKPLDDQSRCTPFDILRWATMLRIKRMIIENVPEFTEWGPLGKDLRPIKRERGSYFASFVQMLRGIGYDVDWRICCAADFGAPTTRRRLFIQAVKKGSGKTIRWPMPTNSRTVEDDLLGMEMKPWIPASSIIDWSIPCTPVDDRATPLAPKTMERILKGIARHWGSAAAPFLERYGRAVSSTEEPGQPSPLITEFYGTGGCRSIGEPLSTISCSGAHHGLVQPLIMEYYGNGGCTPIFNPLGTVTCKERFALVTPENCRLGFRMLQPAELAKAQSFPDWYRFTGTKTEVVKQIGNAVCPAMAKALVN